MASISIGESNLGTSLCQLLMADEMAPGSGLSYELAKTILAWHPLGGKMAYGPVKMAMSQSRKISVPAGPEETLRKAFLDEWAALGCDQHIQNTAGLARAYGLAACVMGLVGNEATEKALTPGQIARGRVFFNDIDPLNMAGSGAFNQDPNSPDFQRVPVTTVSGKTYHPSRVVVMMNEFPLYIEYTASAYGYVGRSVYQRALFPLKSFVQSMLTDDMVLKKAGVLVAKLVQPGGIIDQPMMEAAAYKRDILKSAQTNNVINIGITEDIESLNLTHISECASVARKNVLENAAAAADMPAQALNNETFAEGFGEGTEDAKKYAKYVEGVRDWLRPLYKFFDNIVMPRAWNEELFATLKREYPESFRGVDYQTAFTEWKNSFVAPWPSLLVEPESEQAKSEDVKLKSVIAALEVLLPQMDPDNKATLIEWAANAFNQNKILFPDPLLLDIEAFRNYVPPQPVMGEESAEAEREPAEPKPFAAAA